DGVLAYDIQAVRHRPGHTNPADGPSRQFTGVSRKPEDGGDWSVGEDWESASGLVHDLFLSTVTDEVEQLCNRFNGEPIFLEVINALHNLDSHEDERTRRRARHRAVGYTIDNGKLWRIGDGRTARARARTECITRPEAVTVASSIHSKLHFGRDHIRLQMLDRYCSPCLNQSIAQAI
ncbi:hypothetical protein BV25DRAFT_1780537, partial [Artomyces pyxidatus]